MKNVFFGVFLFCAALLSNISLRAQENFNVTAGFGLPEMLNLGLRMQFQQTQFGLAVGTVPGSEDQNFTLSADFYYHFGGISEYTDLRPWFLKTGFTYLQSENEWNRSTTFVLVPRIGREFNINPKFGIALEAGILLVLYDHEETLKKNPDSLFNFDLDFFGLVLPSAGLNLFYRF